MFLFVTPLDSEFRIKFTLPIDFDLTCSSTVWEKKKQNVLQTDYDQTLKSLFLGHYFKSVCKTTLLWTKFALVQYSYNFSEYFGYIKYWVITNHSCKVT